MGRAFDATMEYLRHQGIISSQSDLARLLDVATASVTGMKQRGAISEKNIEKIAKVLADSNGENLKDTLERLRQELPEVSGQSNSEEEQRGRYNCCQPSSGVYDRFIGEIPTSRVAYSDRVAINKDVIKKHGGCDKIVYMSYLKSNLEPEIRVNDTLVVKITDKIQGEGYYLFDCEYDLDIKYLDFSSTKKDHVQISAHLNATDKEVKSVDVVSDNIMGKIIYLHREI